MLLPPGVFYRAVANRQPPQLAAVVQVKSGRLGQFTRASGTSAGVAGFERGVHPRVTQRGRLTARPAAGP